MLLITSWDLKVCIEIMVTWTVDDFEFHFRFQVLTYQITFGCPGKIRCGRCRMEEMTFVGRVYGCWNKSKERRKKRKTLKIRSRAIVNFIIIVQHVTFTWHDLHVIWRSFTYFKLGGVSVNFDQLFFIVWHSENPLLRRELPIKNT